MNGFLSILVATRLLMHCCFKSVWTVKTEVKYLQIRDGLGEDSGGLAFPNRSFFTAVR